ncbi:hypothetical protein PAMA_020621 [Pampus argenteus]
MHLSCFSAVWIFLLQGHSGLAVESFEASADLPISEETNLDQCPEGTFFSHQLCLECPSGHFCPGNVYAPRRCPTGTFNLYTGKSSVSDCKCGPGKEPNLDHSGCNDCPLGFYSTVCTIQCLQCPAGHYCVGGVAVPCPAGTYGPKEGLQRLKDCTICPAGFYCLEGSSRRPTSLFLCPQGYYCEEGTATLHGSPCPAGTVGEQLGQTSRAACKRCREGRFCPAGSSGPGLPCARGRYCPAGTLEEAICPRGTFTPHQGAISVKDCLKCPAGFYCPEGTSDPVPCPPGSFNPLEGQDELADCRECYAGKACTQVALRAPDVDCMQGFVCPPGSSKPNALTNACPPGTLSNRTDLTDRSQCQRCPARYACLRGHYCPPGTMFPTQYKCPVGTWSGHSGLEAESECRLCPQGWYCLAGSGAPSGRCSSGHYCPEGTHEYDTSGENSSTFRRLKGGQRLEDCSACPAGYFCPHSATVNPRVCGAGSYSDEGSVDCSPCLQGHYCSDETTSEEAMLSVMGFYCPEGTFSPEPCPEGTYASRFALNDGSECSPCGGGQYCTGVGLKEPSGSCKERFYCRQGAKSAGQKLVMTAPQGPTVYREKMSSIVQQDTTVSVVVLRVSCPALLAHTAPSLASAKWSSASYVQQVVQAQCPAQLEPTPTSQASQPVPAALLDTTVQKGLVTLPSYPVLLVSTALMGSASQSKVDWKTCEVVNKKSTLITSQFNTSFNNNNNSFNKIDIYKGNNSLASHANPMMHTSVQKRKVGSVCRQLGTPSLLTWTITQMPTVFVQLPPQGGAARITNFHKPNGNPVRQTYVLLMTEAAIYHVEGSGEPELCPAGTFSAVPGLTSEADCQPCTAGFYCSGAGLRAPTGPCSQGYWCPPGLTVATALPCPRGHFCPQYSAAPEPCPSGTYQDREKQAVCTVCEAGTTLPNQHPCPKGSFNPRQRTDSLAACIPCAAGQYCPYVGLSEPAGTTAPVACPEGTWSNSSGLRSQEDCKPCLGGFYCDSAGLHTPTGYCRGGYYCVEGAITSTPTDGITGGPCPEGYYCPEGTVQPVPCDPGTYVVVTHATRAGSVMVAITALPEMAQLSLDHVKKDITAPTETLLHNLSPLRLQAFCVSPEGSLSLLRSAQLALTVLVEKTAAFKGQCPVHLETCAHLELIDRCPAYRGPTRIYLGRQGVLNAKQDFTVLAQWMLTLVMCLGLTLPCCVLKDTIAHQVIGFMVMCVLQATIVLKGVKSQVPVLQDANAHLDMHAHMVMLSRPSVALALFSLHLGSPLVTSARQVSSVLVVQIAPHPEPPPLHSAVFMKYWRFIPQKQTLPSGCTISPASITPVPLVAQQLRPASCVLQVITATRKGKLSQVASVLKDTIVLRDRALRDHNNMSAQWDIIVRSGSANQQPCPAGTYGNMTGLIEELQCSSCDPGMYCKEPGFYCLEGSQTAAPISSVSGSVCPAGHYCAEGSSVPSPCPAGSYQNETGGKGKDDCKPCPLGKQEAILYKSVIVGKGFIVPGALAEQTRLCAQLVSSAPVEHQSPCPVLQGHLAPEQATRTRTTAPPVPLDTTVRGLSAIRQEHTPSLCAQPVPLERTVAPMEPRHHKGHYCPEGSALPLPCPTGEYQPNPGSDSCIPCRPGFYCEEAIVGEPWPCPPHSFCPAGDAVLHLCPAGHYCDGLSSSEFNGGTGPRPCPLYTYRASPGAGSKGTKRSLPGAAAPTQCEPCAGGTFCPDPWATGKPNVEGIPCRASYQCAIVGSEDPKTAAVVCVRRALIVPTSLLSIIAFHAHQDTIAPKVPPLVPVLVRTVHSSTQMVHVCAELVLSFTTNWISKARCLTVNWTASLRLPQLFAQLSPDGHLLLSIKERGGVAWARTVMDILGPDIHANNIGKIHLVQFDSEGVFGWIPTQREIINQLLSEPTELLNTRPRKRRDTKEEDDDLTVLPRIPNPVACLSSGDMLIFHLTINHTETGKYVFVDSAAPELSIVVVVSDEGTECDPRAAVFQPMTPAQLVRYGIVKQHQLNLLPDWSIITGILSVLLVVVVIVTTTVLVLRPSKAKLVSQWRIKPKWRSLGEPFCPVECVCTRESMVVPSLDGLLGSRGVGEGAEAEEPAVSKGGMLRHCDLEEFNVKTLYDKLEDQNLHIASQLARHRKDTQEFYRNICQQTEMFKNIFENMDYKKLSLLKELLAHNAMRDKSSNSSVRERDPQALLGAVLRSVEALLFRLTGENWHSQDLPGPPYCHTGPPDDTNMCYTQVMQLLANSPLFPSVLLLLAKSVPISSSSSNEGLLAHCSGDFYFDATNQILYLSESTLQHVGYFIATILQSMAHIASDLFLQSKCDASKEQQGALVEEFLNIRVPTEAQFVEHLLVSRLEKYKYFKLEHLISNLKPSSTEATEKGLPPKGTPMQLSCIEEEIDRMNESFLQLSMQLQNRAHMSMWQKERENSAGNHSAQGATPTSMPCLSRNGTILLELKRRYVSQRLNELQITLGQIQQCQQHDSKSKDETRGCKQTDCTKQGHSKHYSDVDGCTPSDGQRQVSIPASQSHSQQTAESRDLGGYKPESHISDQQRSDTVQSPNLDTLIYCQKSQDLLHPNVPGKQDLNSQITVENTTGHTDIDAM